MINREYYLNQIISKMWDGNIKVITGIRRCGKSTLLFELFYDYLIKNRKTKKTAYDYVKRIERICKEYGITAEELFNKKSGYSINDLIGMYSKNGVKSDENRKCHNAPSSALKQFRDFMFND